MGPLQGIRIIEIAGIGPAPYCAMVLADLGATVVRVDRPDGSDLGVPIPASLELLNRGRPSIAVDLKKPESAETVLRLLDGADGLIEGMRPGVMERLGLGPDVCLARNPRLVFGRVTGWGQDGPRAATAGHDINYIAVAGALSGIGRPGNVAGAAAQPDWRLWWWRHVFGGGHVGGNLVGAGDRCGAGG